MNELVTLIIHLAQKSKHIIKMFTSYSFIFLSQSMRGHICEAQACAMWDVVNCDTICDIIFVDDVDYHPKLEYEMTMIPMT